MSFHADHVAGWRRGEYACVLCHEGAKGRKSHKGHFMGRYGCNRGVTMASRYVPLQGSPSADGRLAREVLGGTFEESYPAIWEYLSLRQFDSGQERTTATLTVYVDLDALKLCLNDRQTQRMLWVSSNEYTAAMATLERHLEAGTGEWRPQRPSGKSGRR
jgi:hypothetical protein